MYEKKCTLAQRASASHVTKNLFSWSCGQTTTIGYAHQASLRYSSYVNGEFDSAKNSDFFLANTNSIVVQAKVVTVSGGLRVLVVITDTTIQVSFGKV